jgi:O-antigen/teichoic acid export membrane protein
VTETPPGASDPDGSEDGTRQQIRDSSVLLVGRVIALGLNFLVQVLVVRYLSKAGYGAFAYGLSAVLLGELICTFGLRRAMERFVPIYDQQGEHGKALGAIALALTTIVSLGLALVLVVVGFQDFLAQTLVDDRLTATVLAILIILAPLTALENLIDILFAVYSKPSAIFFRKFILAPLLRLAAVGALITTGEGVQFLAGAYVVAGGVGVVAYGTVLVQTLRRTGVVSREALRGVRIPFREILPYSLPLLSTEVVAAIMHSADALMLGYFGDPEDVAAIGAIVPVARLNELVLTAFALLYTPMAARLFSRGARAAIGDLYWRTSGWVAVLGFPVFAATFALSRPLTTMLFGQEYADSGVLLAILALGYYVHGSFGFNALTLNVLGRLRLIVVINLTGAVTAIVVNLLLIPRFGAVGAAVGTTSTLLVLNIGRQLALVGGGIKLPPRRSLKVYLLVVVATGVLLAVELLLRPSLMVGLPVAAAVSLLLLWLARDSLAIADTFPEIARIPVLGRLLARR